MKISGFLKQTLADYPGKLAAEVFTAGCNYRCPTCHAKHIVEGREQYSEDEIFAYLNKAKGFVDGIVICGGEPTLQHDLPDFLRRVKKETGLPVKLDTNGSNPFMLGDLYEEKLVDYVALDIKGPPSLYRNLIGLADDARFDLRDDIEKAIGSVQNFPDFEFRTTIVPIYETVSACSRLRPQMPIYIDWINPAEIKDMAEWVRGFVPIDPKEVKWYLQKFVARPKGDGTMLDERLAKENLPAEYRETPEKVLLECRDALRNCFPKTEMR